jgi:dipeptidyl aminopeptidase/acylaminoacyl peptidase
MLEEASMERNMTRPITPADLWNLRRVGQPEHVPNTTKAVVAVSDYHDDGKEASVLHLVDRDGTTVQITDRGIKATSPSPSPDGGRIAFLGLTGGGEDSQIYVVPGSGGDATKVTDFPRGVRAFEWVPGSNALIAAVRLYRDHLTVEATASHKEDREDKTLPVVTEDRNYRFWKRWLAGETIDHLFVIDLDSGESEDLTPNIDKLIAYDDIAGTFTVTPDGATVIFTLDATEPAWDYPEFTLHRVPVAGGRVEEIATMPAARHSRPRVSPDGSTLVYGAQFEHAYYADLVRLVSHHLATGTEQILTSSWDRSAGGWEFIDNECLVLHAEDEGHLRIFTTSLDERTPTPVTGGSSNHGARVGVDCYWHRHESMHQPPEVAVTSSGHTSLVTKFNADLLGEIDLRPAEEIRFEGAQGDQIQAFIVEPPGFTSGTTWPLVHNVHGGPHNGVMDAWHWRWNPQVMAAAGRVVVSVNFHGSSSFGDAFTRSIRTAWGDMPLQDIDAATDHMLGLGFIDEDRMAIAGGSYGGYLVAWIATQTDRYAASICHAGVTDLLGQWASDLTEGREIPVGGVPWEDMDAVQRWSPMAHTHDIVTPTLVIHGELDYRVVATQGLVLYGVLKHKGVPSRLVYYRDEGHWIEKQPNALHWWGEFLGWLDRWI